MKTRYAALLAAVSVTLCVGAACGGLLMAWQTMRPQVAPWQAWTLLRSAREQACSERPMVPGSYQVDPVRSVGGYAVVTYAAECVGPGGQAQWTTGYVARGASGGCAGAGTGAMTTRPSGGVGFEGLSGGGCGGPGPGGNLQVFQGRVVGGAADRVAVTFADGTVATEPVRNERFAVVTPGTVAACAVRALDAHGNVVATEAVDLWLQAPGMGRCP
jgi:hypothetical protein